MYVGLNKDGDKEYMKMNFSISFLNPSYQLSLMTINKILSI